MIGSIRPTLEGAGELVVSGWDTRYLTEYLESSKFKEARNLVLESYSRTLF